MLEEFQIEKILFLDIETVPQYPCYEDQPERIKNLWNKKGKLLASSDNDTPESLYPRAGIYAEFGKIICISVAYLHNDQLRVKSFFGEDEKLLLVDFANLLQKFFNTNEHLLCGHNAKEFDFPYIARRMLINKIKIPKILDVAGKKPWEVNHLDTMQLWKFGDYKNYTSLELLSSLFDIPTPKDDIDGSMVWEVYWKDKNLNRIREYCEKDTITVVRLFQSFRGEEFVKEDSIFYQP
jgi:DNA polymerase elongation subunit (family B)